ncbi:MAG TPA: hypothetical protein VFI11_11475 [Anaerolineales bacterium]|nr:hypothetical protein [Anaerolineales bacterium]
MTNRSSLILLFAIAFSVFIIVPAFLSQPFPPYPLMHVADAFDLLTPFVLMALYWFLFNDPQRSAGQRLAFVLLAALWVSGQAMHLGANSINNLMGEGVGSVHDLVHFYDEVLSHYLWHLGIIGLSVLLILSAGGDSTNTVVDWRWILPASILYGLTFFLAVNEGGTVPLGLPAAALITVWIGLTRRAAIRRQPLVAFFFVGYALALLALAGWGIYWKGFPEFTDVGLL